MMLDAALPFCLYIEKKSLPKMAWACKRMACSACASRRDANRHETRWGIGSAHLSHRLLRAPDAHEGRATGPHCLLLRTGQRLAAAAGQGHASTWGAGERAGVTAFRQDKGACRVACMPVVVHAEPPLSALKQHGAITHHRPATAASHSGYEVATGVQEKGAAGVELIVMAGPYCWVGEL